jgi:hypothetical protein
VDTRKVDIAVREGRLSHGGMIAYGRNAVKLIRLGRACLAQWQHERGTPALCQTGMRNLEQSAGGVGDQRLAGADYVLVDLLDEARRVGEAHFAAQALHEVKGERLTV